MTEPPDKDVSHYVRVEIQLKRPCPVCGSRKAVRDGLTGEVCCSRCGLVLNSPHDEGLRKPSLPKGGDAEDTLD